MIIFNWVYMYDISIPSLKIQIDFNQPTTKKENAQKQIQNGTIKEQCARVCVYTIVELTRGTIYSFCSYTWNDGLNGAGVCGIIIVWL